MNKTSSYEQKIILILKNQGISFEREKRFPDLHYGYYRFDFFIPQINILIEVDGEQHFHFTKRFHKKRSDFLKAQERDRAKNSYCLAKKIRLFRIPFWQVDKITNLEDIINEKFLVKSKYHNDNIWREYQKNG